MIIQLPEIVNETLLDKTQFLDLDNNHLMDEKNKVKWAIRGYREDVSPDYKVYLNVAPRISFLGLL